MKRSLLLLFSLFILFIDLSAQFKKQERFSEPINQLRSLHTLYNYRLMKPSAELDSIVWSLNMNDDIGFRKLKEVYTFDSAGNPVEINEYAWGSIRLDGINDWVNNHRTEIEYDESGRDTSVIEYVLWIDSNSKETGWKKASQTTKQYTGTGELTNIYYYTFEKDYPTTEDIWDVKTTFDAENRVVRQTCWSKMTNDSTAVRYEYDESGNMASEINSEWSYNEQKWIDIKIYTYNYNENNLLTEQIVQRFSNDKWYNEDRLVMKYNPEFQLISVDVFTMESSNIEWNTKRSEYAIFYYRGNDTGTEKVELSTMKIWSENQLIHIESEADIASVHIYNVAGNLLYQVAPKGNILTVASPAGTGIYLIDVRNIHNKRKVEKVTIR